MQNGGRPPVLRYCCARENKDRREEKGTPRREDVVAEQTAAAKARHRARVRRKGSIAAEVASRAACGEAGQGNVVA